MRLSVMSRAASQSSRLTVLVCLLLTLPASAQVIRYVDADAPDGGDGLSWNTAFDDLHVALAAAAADPSIDQLWVAAGTYATGGTPFPMLDALHIYGGFAGDETSLAERAPDANLTVLDGSSGGSAVVDASADTTARLDGFTITSADTTHGLYAQAGSPTIAGCLIVENAAAASGAGAYFASGAPLFIDCEFADNVTGNRGGGMYLAQGQATFANCRFRDNDSFAGGGCGTNTGAATFINCIWHDNHGRFGGAAYTFSGALSFTNCTVTYNQSQTSGGGLYAFSGSLDVANSIIYGNTASNDPQIHGTATVSYSCIEGGFTGAGNIAAEPRFENIGGRDLRVIPPSACIDAGNNVLVPADVLDLDGDGDITERIPLDHVYQSRFVDSTTVSDVGVADPPLYPAIIDMGAYEHLDDCNNNGIPDGIDIAQGTSEDCNANGYPDECELDGNDCNNNGIPDDCDLGGVAVPEYAYDDGSAENALGLTGGGTVAWLTRYSVGPGGELLRAVRVAYGDVAVGTPVTVYVWSDPNRDADPSDAQVIASAEGIVQVADWSTFNFVAVPPTYIGEAGTIFFVGVLLDHLAGELPAALDEDNSQGLSFIAADSDGVNPNDLGGAGVFGVADGNWLVRAVPDGAPANDCNVNGVPDDCDIADGTSSDCHANGIPDECELSGNDCNGNLVPDDCDVAGGFSADCQGDGIPDECQLYTGEEHEYRYDDWTADFNIGFSPDVHIAWLNRFLVTPELQRAAAVAVSYGPLTPGTEATVYIWSDPDGDGDPADAQVIASAETTVVNPGSDFFDVVSFPAVYLGEPGTSFFAGVILTSPEGNFPCALDQTSSAGESWIIANDAVPPNQNYPIDPNDLRAPYPGQLAGIIDDFGYPGNWLIHVRGTPGNDCNLNGVPDECDITAGTSLDINGNGTPDECDNLGDLDGDGNVDGGDFVLFADCLAGPDVAAGCEPALGALSDVDADGDVDLHDLAGLAQLVSPAIRALGPR